MPDNFLSSGARRDDYFDDVFVFDQHLKTSACLLQRQFLRDQVIRLNRARFNQVKRIFQIRWSAIVRCQDLDLLLPEIVNRNFDFLVWVRDGKELDDAKVRVGKSGLRGSLLLTGYYQSYPTLVGSQLDLS